MSAVTHIEATDVAHVLAKLLGRDVSVLNAVDEMSVHERTFRGLVTDEDELVGLIAADPAFAHASGAALAMVPPARLEELDDEELDDELLEFYVEVANVLSRVVNEASPDRVRIDPSMDHDASAMLALMESASGVGVAVDIEGYGVGLVSMWSTR